MKTIGLKILKQLVGQGFSITIICQPFKDNFWSQKLYSIILHIATINPKQLYATSMHLSSFRGLKRINSSGHSSSGYLQYGIRCLLVIYSLLPKSILLNPFLNVSIWASDSRILSYYIKKVFLDLLAFLHFSVSFCIFYTQ